MQEKSLQFWTYPRRHWGMMLEWYRMTSEWSNDVQMIEWLQNDLKDSFRKKCFFLQKEKEKGEVGLFKKRLTRNVHLLCVQDWGGLCLEKCIYCWFKNIFVKVSKNYPLFLAIFLFFDANLLGVFWNTFILGLSWHCNAKVPKIWPLFRTIF